MLTGIYQSAAILAAAVLFYIADFWLIHHYDKLRAHGSSRSWSYTIKLLAAALFVIAQPVLCPWLGLATDAAWGLVVQALGAGLVLGALALHWWARTHLGQFYGEREELQPGQHLVTSGPYAHMRHPIYTSYFGLTIGLLLINPALPTLLAVLYALVDFTQATRREEKLLVEGLPGYADYMAHTPRFCPRLTPRRQEQSGLD
ncbi:MAG: isoprenylcysteine carboxylmethyltransferase family protein [Chloroflexi bacterium]|nr:isoprenylcysteine carboxylmethyltransferase family protein [Chloroflexota bacterium]MBU1750718.1 isoprenylcysteine carboxylmethyltransferase family protein [Chloroflexota bacterium]